MTVFASSCSGPAVLRPKLRSRNLSPELAEDVEEHDKKDEEQRYHQHRSRATALHGWRRDWGRGMVGGERNVVYKLRLGPVIIDLHS